MRILQVLPCFAAGGAETFVVNLSVELVRMGHSVGIFCSAQPLGPRGRRLEAFAREGGVQLVNSRPTGVRSVRSVARLALTMSRWRPDVVLTNLRQSEVITGVASMVTLMHRPVFFHRCASTADAIATLGRGLFRPYGRAVIACSEAVGEALRGVATHGESVSSHVIRNGVLFSPHERNQLAPGALRSLLGAGPGSFVVVHVGRMWGSKFAQGLAGEPKAQDVLLEAFALAFRDSNAFLWLVGDGPLRRLAEQHADRLGISSQVKFLGERNDVGEILGSADAFAFPSRWEGMPNALIEAAGAGLPIVASTIKEIASLNKHGTWDLRKVDDPADFADGLRRVRMELPEKVRVARSLAPVFRESFSMEGCAKQYEKLFSTALHAVRVRGNI